MNKQLYQTVFAELGLLMQKADAYSWQSVIDKAHSQNQWFTPDNTLKALHSLGQMLTPDDLDKWLRRYAENKTCRRVGIIMAGNIPLVGLHDLLCVLAAGHRAVVKMSSNDNVLLPHFVSLLNQLSPELAERVTLVDKLANYDAAIATGSNNSALHFQYYFRQVPHIIRRNRHAVAVLSGTETLVDMQALGEDIFSYFGLGCRNVSKLYLPEGYNIARFYEPLETFAEVKNHNKYANNHTYQKAIHLMNLVPVFDNDFLLLVEHEQIASPTATCHYQYYTHLTQVEEMLMARQEEVQCIVSTPGLFQQLSTVNFGQSQHPKLWDYADGVDTMQWLAEL